MFVFLSLKAALLWSPMCVLCYAVTHIAVLLGTICGTRDVAVTSKLKHRATVEMTHITNCCKKGDSESDIRVTISVYNLCSSTSAILHFISIPCNVVVGWLGSLWITWLVYGVLDVINNHQIYPSGTSSMGSRLFESHHDTSKLYHDNTSHWATWIRCKYT